MTGATGLTDRASRPASRDAALVVVAFVVAGAVAGLVWPHLVTPVTVTRTEDGISTGELALAHQFDNDGWYAVLARVVGFSLGAAMVAWRRSDVLVTVLACLLGAGLAAWSMAAVGHLTGPADPSTVLANARVGGTAAEEVQVAARAAYLVWPIAAAVGVLAVLLSPLSRLSDET